MGWRGNGELFHEYKISVLQSEKALEVSGGDGSTIM